MSLSVMVLDGETIAGLATTRALDKEGFKVICGGSHRFSRTFYSKHRHKKFVYSSIKFGFQKMHQNLLRNLKKFKPDILIPVFSETSELVLKYKREYEKYTEIIPMVDYDLFKKISDKQKLMELMDKLKIPIPKTYFPKNGKEIKILSKKIKYPVLIKARLSSGGRGIKIAYSPKELVNQYKAVIQLKSIVHSFNPTRPIIQEYIEGKNIDISALFFEGKKIAHTVQENKHFYQGIYTRNVLIKNDKISNIGLKLLKKLKWNGVAHIDMKIDARDGIPRILEINPKLWSSIESSIYGGVNFPYLLCKLALNKNIKSNEDYKIGSEFRMILFGELLYLWYNKNKIKLIKELLNFKNYNCEIQIEDIKPHIIQILTFPFDKSRV